MNGCTLLANSFREDAHAQLCATGDENSPQFRVHSRLGGQAHPDHSQKDENSPQSRIRSRLGGQAHPDHSQKDENSPESVVGLAD
jgi:hypothetical protein